ncbi:phage tail protein [Sphingomonas sp.]|uniref:phage tail protein n=1 Tax=Sphingomonas sp. TaxID=28214 RepID=UPI002FD9A625
MATVVLTVAGGLIGGPFGASLGGLVGNAIDHQLLFRQGPREGARLADLRVQTSSYGTTIPQLFGTMRVAGCVIWATDLIEHRATEGGGKGRPSTTAYSYTASFAVALSTRPILDVRRIWADGQLLRGAAGDFKIRTGFRLHTGKEDQPVDPLIAAIEGPAQAPAHRGTAYVVFEDLELASFGNRIPQLSFEVIADAAPVSAGAVMEAVSGMAAEGLNTPLAGFSAQEATRTTLDALCAATGAWVHSDGAGMRLQAGPGPARAMSDGGVGARARPAGRGVRAIAAADGAPRRLSIGYYDPARDYQAGVQQASRPGTGTRETRIDLPAVLDARSAKAMAAGALARTDLARERRTLTLGWDALALAPGARITIDGTPGQWRVDRWSLENMVVKLECVPIAEAPLDVPASAGRAAAAPDEQRGSTILMPFELPPLDDVPMTTPSIVVAAAGSAAGWRRAALLASLDQGASWTPAGETAYPAILGMVTLPPAPARAALIDQASFAEITLARPDMALANADPAALDAGANLAMLGDELLQFGRAESLGGMRWRLSHLWRGRRGTEAAIGTQRPGDRFVLVTRDTLKPLDLRPSFGTVVQLLAQGPSDPIDPAPAEALATGISLLPPSPAQLRATRSGDETQLRWVRRSRTGWTWRDGVDVPLGEESERYQVEISSAAATRISTVEVPELVLSAADRAAGVTVRVRQVGTHGLSVAAQLSLPSLGDDR